MNKKRFKVEQMTYHYTVLELMIMLKTRKLIFTQISEERKSAVGLWESQVFILQVSHQWSTRV